MRRIFYLGVDGAVRQFTPDVNDGAHYPAQVGELVGEGFGAQVWKVPNPPGFVVVRSQHPAAELPAVVALALLGADAALPHLDLGDRIGGPLVGA